MTIRDRILDYPRGTPKAPTTMSWRERSILENLVEAGLLERRGAKRGRTYLLSAAVYRDLGKPADYVRARGFEPEQMEQMVLQYVRAHGSIARRAVTDLCRITERQATYLLRKLVEQGLLRQHGLGRGTTYATPETDKTDK